MSETTGPATPPTTPEGLPVPARPGLVEAYWPGPGAPATPAVISGGAATGLLAASTFFTERVGVQVGLLGSAVCAVAVAAARRRPDAVRSPARTALAGLAVALAWVPAVRDGAPSVVLSILGALGLAALAAVDGRTWPSVLLAGPAAGLASLRVPGWVWRRLSTVRRPAGLGAWVRGGLLALVVAWAIGGLLASADSAFAAVVDVVLPRIDLGTLPGRAALFLVVTAVTLTAAVCAAAPPRWERIELPHRARPVVEWALPLAVVDAVLALFVGVQGAVMFAAHPDELLGTGTTAAERARQGFGQLVVVTLIAVMLLSWAARRSGADPSRRRLFAVLGGVQVVLVLVVVASALRRMALYESYFGWTVLRVNVAAFEVWLAVVLVLCAVAWLTRRTAWIARGVALAAGSALLVLNLASPDALAASANVDRFERTGKIDLTYLGRLSDDAVPALVRLPTAQRTQALDGRKAADDPWYAANVSRLRAASLLGDAG